MSFSGKSTDNTDEFSYQTRLVVYNFLGLVPAMPPSDEDAETSQLEQPLETRTSQPATLPWNETLETLPTMSLIDRLSESEYQQIQMKDICNEVVRKVQLVELSDTQTKLQLDEAPLNEPKHKRSHIEKLDLEEAHQAVLGELKQKILGCGQSPSGSTTEESLIGQITIIKKRNRLKIFSDSVTPAEDVEVLRRLSLQTTSSDVPFSRSLAQAMPHTATVGMSIAFSGRFSSARRPTTLPSLTPADPTNASSRERLSQIDEEQELAEHSSGTLEDMPINGPPNMEAGMPTSGLLVHLAPQRLSTVLTPTGMSMERQSSNLSGSSRRCSTYIDITEVDVENLVKAKALPPVTIPLKRELSIALEELGRRNPDSDEMDGQNKDGFETLKSPESEVADSLRALGDRIQEEYGAQLDLIVHNLMGFSSSDSAVSYETLHRLSLQLLQQTQNGWTKVALMMMLGQQLIFGLLRQGYTEISHLAEYTAMLVEDNAADFIINNGGWNSISDIGVVETEAPLSPLDITQFYQCPGTKVEPTINQPDDVPTDSAIGSNTCFDSDDDVEANQTSSKENSAKESLSSSSDAHLLTSECPIARLSSSQTDTAQADQSLAHDILLLRNNSQQYVEEMESMRRAESLTQSNALAGLAILTILASWLIYRNFRKAD